MPRDCRSSSSKSVSNPHLKPSKSKHRHNRIGREILRGHSFAWRSRTTILRRIARGGKAEREAYDLGSPRKPCLPRPVVLQSYSSPLLSFGRSRESSFPPRGRRLVVLCVCV